MERRLKKDRGIDISSLVKETTRYDHALTDKERAILAAAEDLFAEKGASDTPTAEIAKKAGVTEKTLFRYFPSKCDLLRRVMFPVLLKTLVPAQMGQMRSLFKNSESGIEALFTSIFLDRLAVARENKGKIRFMLGEVLKDTDLRSQVLRLWEQEVWSEAVATIESLQKTGQIRKDLTAATITRTFFSIIMAYVLAKHVLGGSPKWNDHDEMQQILDILLNGIKK